MNISEIVARQRAYFQTGATRPLAFRLEALRRLRAQPSAAFYAEKCDFAFYNGGDRDAAETAANEIDRIAVGEANA